MSVSAGGGVADLHRRGVVPINEAAFVFEEMLEGFSRQQVSRGLAKKYCGYSTFATAEVQEVRRQLPVAMVAR